MNYVEILVLGTGASVMMTWLIIQRLNVRNTTDQALSVVVEHPDGKLCLGVA